MFYFTFTLCGLLSFASLIGAADNGWSLRQRWGLDEARNNLDAEKPTQWELRQRFLLDLLLQVHKPILQQELIDLGRQLSENSSDYESGSWPLLTDFMERVHNGRILRPYSIYSQLHDELPQQLLDVYRFLVLAKDWKTFQRNACYARSHFNPVLFVTALQLAVEDRSDTQDFRLPAMHEVLPQLYFNREVILDALQINWQQLAPVPTISLKRSWKDILLGFVFPRLSSKPMEMPLMPAEPIVIEVKSTENEAQLSLDVELNGYWSRLISRLMLTAKSIQDKGLMTDLAREECAIAQTFAHNINQFVALLEMEQMARGGNPVELVIPSLMTTGGVPFKSTQLNVEEIRELITVAVKELQNHIDEQLSELKAENNCIVVLEVTRQFNQLCRKLSLAINGNIVEPNLLGMATSNLRDPIYRSLLYKVSQLMANYNHSQEWHSSERKPLQLRHVNIGPLVTYDQLVDVDLINLIDQQLLQTQRNNLQLLRRRLVARQHRLNHKPFNMIYSVYARESLKILVRSYLIPYGQSHPRLLLDSFVSNLVKGINILQRHFPTASNMHTLSDLYEAKEPLANTKPCLFPQHLLLPRGTTEGLKLQLLIELLPWNSTDMSSDCDWLGSNADLTAPVISSLRLNVLIKHQN